MDDDREYLPLSWLSQASYCLRRAALLMNERVWFENEETAKGRTEHERVHTKRIERRGELIKLYEYEVNSQTLGISGKCDCIEVTRNDNGCKIPACDFSVSLYPIEYKHGTVREEPEYMIQLCAEAMCLEEMYNTSIPKADLYYISSHKRQTVILNDGLRQQVREIACTLRNIREQLTVPAAQYSTKCKRCSLREYCMPQTKQSARRYCEELLREVMEDGGL
jgi:CRISPR-associated exonuclease Cas4